MASVIKRKSGSYAVVYYANIDGEKQQVWETFDTKDKAKKRKAKVEVELSENDYVAPNKQTIEEFLEDFVKLYGEEKWALSTFDANIAMIRNYINPLIGDIKLQDFSVKSAAVFLNDLKKCKAVGTGHSKGSEAYIGTGAIVKIYKLLKCAFGQAVRWEAIKKNPFEFVDEPAHNEKKRAVWDISILKKALDSCRDSKLYLAMNLSFACSLRIGEILGLQWENVHISEAEIAGDNAYVYIDRELQRVSLKTLKRLGKKDVLEIFPPLKANAVTRLVLKKPKTESSIRKIWLPKTVAYILIEYRKHQEKMREYVVDEQYFDYDLVFTTEVGRPIEERVINKAFDGLKKSAQLPEVVFHSLRHSSATFKLKINKGDIKATQGDTGHAQASVLTNIYAHIIDEDRKENAVKMERAFYADPGPDLRDVKASNNNLDIAALVETLQNAPPETLELLSSLINVKK